MKNIKKSIIASLFLAAFFTSSCEFGDINQDPDNLIEAPIAQQLSNLTVNVGFMAGSDLNRYASLIMQQYSGQSTGAVNQTQQYESCSRNFIDRSSIARDHKCKDQEGQHWNVWTISVSSR